MSWAGASDGAMGRKREAMRAVMQTMIELQETWSRMQTVRPATDAELGLLQRMLRLTARLSGQVADYRGWCESERACPQRYEDLHREVRSLRRQVARMEKEGDG